MARLTDAQVKRIWTKYNELANPTFAEVARMTGHSTGTVSKYVNLCLQALEAQRREKASVENAVGAVVDSQMATKTDLEKAVELILAEYHKK